MEASKITTACPTRPCYVDDEVKAIFHGWVDKIEIISPGIMVGSHNGGTIRDTLALVEFEDGSVAKVYPSRVRFSDGGAFKDMVFRRLPRKKND